MATALSTEVVSQQTQLQARVSSLVVTCDKEHADAMSAVKDVKALKKSIEEYFAPMVEAAHAAHKAMTQARKDATAPLDAMEADIKAKILPYVQKKAIAEREAAEAEQKRLREESEAKRVLAEDAEVFGDTQEVVALQAEASILRHQAAAIVPGKAHGTRDNWKWRIADQEAVPRAYMKVDEQLLDGIAKTKKGDASVPGITFYNEPIVVVR